MAAFSKELTDGEKSSASKIVLTSAFFQWVTIYICAQAETQLYVQLAGTPAAAGSLLASTMAASGLVEFLVGPSFGKLTDCFGRRIFFFVYPVYGLVMWTAMAAFPVSRVLRTSCALVLWPLQMLTAA